MCSPRCFSRPAVLLLALFATLNARLVPAQTASPQPADPNQIKLDVFALDKLGHPGARPDAAELYRAG